MYDVKLQSLTVITSGASHIVVGRRVNEGDYYCPCVEGNKWLFQGTVVELLNSDIYPELRDKVIEFISTIESDTKPFIRVLI